jgi:hypothetical protein
MVAMTGMQFPIHALRAQIASAIHVVIQTERHEDGRRRLTSLQEINGMEGDTITMSEIFTFTRRGLDAAGNVLARTGSDRHRAGLPATHETAWYRLVDRDLRRSAAATGAPAMSDVFLWFGALVFIAMFLLAQGLVVPAFGKNARCGVACASGSQRSNRKRGDRFVVIAATLS